MVLSPRLTGSGLWADLVLAVDTGIQAVLLPFAGTVADRVDRRRIVLVANAAGVPAVFACAPGASWPGSSARQRAAEGY
jgi:MFS family permease